MISTFLVQTLVVLTAFAAPAQKARDLGTYRVTTIEQRERVKGRPMGAKHLVCKKSIATPTEGNKPNLECGSLVKVFRTENDIMLTKTEIGIYPSTGGRYVESFLLASKIFGAKCKRYVSGDKLSSRLLDGRLCRASRAPELDKKNDEVFTFFRDTTNPAEDAKLNASFLFVFTGGLLPIGFGQAHEIHLPKDRTVPELITIDQVDEIVFGFSGTVFKKFSLERVAD